MVNWRRYGGSGRNVPRRSYNRVNAYHWRLESGGACRGATVPEQGLKDSDPRTTFPLSNWRSGNRTRRLV